MTALAEVLRARLAVYKTGIWHRPTSIIPRAEAAARARGFFARPIFRLFRR